MAELEKVSLVTKDGVEIVGDHYKSDLTIGHTILAAHMMPADRKSWKDFAEVANLAGYDLLAIDLRGHGESVNKGGQKIDYHNFTDREHQESIKDLEAAMDFLSEKGIEESQMTLMGASIGSSLCLQLMKTNVNLYTGVLLSPGSNYRGIDTEAFATGLSGPQSVLLVGGDKDQQSYGSLKKLKSLIRGSVETIVVPNEAHGTELFTGHPKLMVRILAWLNEEIS